MSYPLSLRRHRRGFQRARRCVVLSPSECAWRSGRCRGGARGGNARAAPVRAPRGVTCMDARMPRVQDARERPLVRGGVRDGDLGTIQGSRSMPAFGLRPRTVPDSNACCATAPARFSQAFGCRGCARASVCATNCQSPAPTDRACSSSPRSSSWTASPCSSRHRAATATGIMACSRPCARRVQRAPACARDRLRRTTAAQRSRARNPSPRPSSVQRRRSPGALPGQLPVGGAAGAHLGNCSCIAYMDSPTLSTES